MTPPELAGDIALNLLADLQRHQREGTLMPDPIEDAARARHAAMYRRHDPEATDEKLTWVWNRLGETTREWYLNEARKETSA